MNKTKLIDSLILALSAGLLLVLFLIAFGKITSNGPGLAAAHFGSVVAAAIGLFLTFRTLYVTHKWQRQNYALDLMRKWNDEARPQLYKLAVSHEEILDRPKDFENLAEWKLSRGQAEEAFSVGGTPERNQIILILNYFEHVAEAYERNLVDRKVVDECIAPTLVKTCIYLRDFIRVERDRFICLPPADEGSQGGDNTKNARKGTSWTPLMRMLPTFRERTEEMLNQSEDLVERAFRGIPDQSEKRDSEDRKEQATLKVRATQ